MDRSSDLYNTYRAAVKSGMYEEAARIQRTMMGGAARADSSLLAELKSVEQQSEPNSLIASLRLLLSRKPRA